MAHMPPVLSYINSKLRSDNLAAARPKTAGVAAAHAAIAPHRPATAASSASRGGPPSRPLTAGSPADLFKRRTRKGRTFLRDNDAADTLLPQPLPEGIPLVASYTTFDELIERQILVQPTALQVHLSTDDVRLMYEAKCLDQDLKPTWEREMRFMELLTASCKGMYFGLRENGLGAYCAEAIAHVLAESAHYAVVDLSGNRLRDQGAEHMARLLRANTNIVHLSLKSNDVGHVGGEAIAAALIENNTLTSLDLGGISGVNRNHLGSRGAAAIGQVLQANRILTHLNLGSNGLGADGIALLAAGLEGNTTITHLDLSSNNLGAEGCRNLASVLESTALEVLHLQRNGVGDAGCRDLCDALARCGESGTETLTHLFLDDNGIREAGAHHLARYLQLSFELLVLHLSENPLGPGAKEVADALKDSRRLRELTVASTGMRTGEAAAFAVAIAAGARGLETLSMSHNRIYDAGVRAVADAMRRNKAVTSLDLSDTTCSSEGGRALAVMLHENSHLRELAIRQNQMDGAAGSAIEDAMRENTTLIKMDHAFNDFNFRISSSIANALKRNAAQWALDQVPRLERQIAALDEDQKELYRVLEEADLERRAAKERGDDLLRRKEANRTHLERFRQDLETVREEEAVMAAQLMQLETLFRQEEDKMNAKKEACDRKVTALSMRVQNEREKREAAEREIEKLRRKMKQVRDAEEVALHPLREQYRRADNERQSDLSDAKWQSENLAATQLKMKQLELQLGLTTQGVAKAPPAPPATRSAGAAAAGGVGKSAGKPGKGAAKR